MKCRTQNSKHLQNKSRSYCVDFADGRTPVINPSLKTAAHLPAVTMQNTVLWNVTPYSLVLITTFRRNLLQPSSEYILKIVSYFETSIKFYQTKRRHIPQHIILHYPCHEWHLSRLTWMCSLNFWFFVRKIWPQSTLVTLARHRFKPTTTTTSQP